MNNMAFCAFAQNSVDSASKRGYISFVPRVRRQQPKPRKGYAMNTNMNCNMNETFDRMTETMNNAMRTGMKFNEDMSRCWMDMCGRATDQVRTNMDRMTGEN